MHRLLGLRCSKSYAHSESMRRNGAGMHTLCVGLAASQLKQPAYSSPPVVPAVVAVCACAQVCACTMCANFQLAGMTRAKVMQAAGAEMQQVPHPH